MRITESQELNELKEQYEIAKTLNMKSLFQKDAKRFHNFSIKFNDILFDFSKNIITNDSLTALLKIVEGINLKQKIESLFTGEKINITENRAALHTALRQKSDKPVYVDNENIIPKVKSELAKMEIFVNKIHNGELHGVTGEKFTTIVNIGIGGSDLGPAMVVEALQHYMRENTNTYFVSNVDGTDIFNILKKIQPEKTLFIIASKTFTTQETLTNAITAKEWMYEKLGDKPEVAANHFVALSTNISACEEFGINRENIFSFWDWVGGRYSLWSSIGLSIAISIGMNNFYQLLDGANEIDEHFRYTSFEKNIPVIMALIGIWYNNFFNANSHCIIPYEQNLSKFPAFLQQLDMESNGKSVKINGNNISYNTAPIVWGTAGTNAQHSFFQLLHQVTQIIPTDFIAFIKPQNAEKRAAVHHKILLSNFFAQTEALMQGKSELEATKELIEQELTEIEIQKLLPHKIFKGNKPTNSFLINELNPKNLGSLIALYEHKVFVQGCIWEINSFDQWGVELGKQLAKKILPELDSDDIISSHDASTNELINAFKKQ